MSKMAEDFAFKRPEEAPTFYPSAEEFADPLAYISKIRPTAENYGICKIKPPAYWAPPFAVDVDKFKFVPRIQKINELEAITRIKLNFLDQISKFWELQGTSLRIPVFGHKALDLYTLHKLVHHQNEYDYNKINDDRRWNMIAARMGLQSNGKMSVGSQLKAHYDKILYPYDVWKQNQGKKKIDSPKKMSSNGNTKGRMGGRMNGGRTKPDRFDPLANYVCQNCKGGDVEDKMLLCDGCDDSYHTFCLKPPLDDVPKGEWRCPDCLEEKLSRPNDGFGFEQATREYTLQQFGEMADTFKSDYFNMPVHMVSSEMVEKEFWRIVSAIDEDVIVEYGADLHTMDHGSGFPTVSNSVSDSDEVYINSGWNLNKLPVLNGSVFAHINADISGMKIPWMYVGMCFSTFCWHNEDHWSYSINYLHWGEPKTWYGVPGGKADQFENAMKSAAPELFAQAPDLLHQLVTIMNPNILMKSNVPVYRMDQKAGEFIITFPRAYHAGFNQGYNFAEAVNFAPADWVAMGRECVLHYSRLNRFCVFSHDELVCAMAADPEKLDYLIALATYKDMLKLFEAEKEQRKAVHEWGLKSTERMEFEHLADDGRQCNVCKTTLFLSAISCNHSRGSSAKDTKLVCLKHYDQYGCKECKKEPANHIMKYRYTLDELPEMIKSLKSRTEKYENWVKTVSEGLLSKDQKLSLEELRELIDEAETHEYPKTELLESAKKVLAEAEKASKIAKALIGTPAVRTRKGCASDLKFKCSITELKLLSEEISYLRVSLSERQYVTNLYHKAKELQEKVIKFIETSNVSLDEMSDCLEETFILDVEFEEALQLRNKYLREKWLRLANSDDDEDAVWTFDYLRKIIEEGNDIHRNESAEKRMEELCVMFQHAHDWEDAAFKIVSSKEKHPISKLEELVEKSEDIHVALPSLQNLREVITKANNWLEKVKNIQDPKPPFLDDLISIVNIGDCLPVEFEHMKALESQISAANIWKENCMKVFLKRNSTIELIEALVPRREIPTIPLKGKRKRLVTEGPSLTFIANTLGIPPPDVKNEASLTDAFWGNVTTEINAMKALRKANLEKLISSEQDARFCVCQKPKDVFMIRCELCLEWFHPTCVPLPRFVFEDVDGMPSHAVMAFKIACRETKFLGPCCARSRRPKYPFILELLVGLNNIPLRMVEGIALQCMTDRAMRWQEQCDKFMQLPVIKEATSIVKKHSSNLSTSPVKKVEVDEITNSEVKSPSHKIFFDPELASHSSNPNGIVDVDVVDLDTKDSLSPMPSPSPLKSPMAVEASRELEVALCLAGMQQGTVHSPVNQTIISATRGPEQSVEPKIEDIKIEVKEEYERTDIDTLGELIAKIRLNPKLIREMDNLVIEADLMEVSAEDSDILWKLYDLANPTVAEIRDLKEIQNIIQQEISSKGLESWEKKQEVKAKQEMRKRKRTLSDGPDGRVKVRKSPVSSPRKRKSSGEGTSRRNKKENQECDEDCAAVKCRQPTGKEVNWIQCDLCDQWFHLTCVGLKKSQVKNLEKYKCIKCEDKKQTPLCDADDGSSCDTDSKLSSSGKISISSNKENTDGGTDRLELLKEEQPSPECATNSLSVFSKVN